MTAHECLFQFILYAMIVLKLHTDSGDATAIAAASATQASVRES